MFGTERYVLFPEAVNRAQATAKCEREGGQLAIGDESMASYSKISFFQTMLKFHQENLDDTAVWALVALGGRPAESCMAVSAHAIGMHNPCNIEALPICKINA